MSSITSFLDGVTQSFTNNQFLDKIMNSGPGEIPYVAFGMVGVSVATLLYVTLTDSAESIGKSVSESFENIGAFKSSPVSVSEKEESTKELVKEETAKEQEQEQEKEEESAKELELEQEQEQEKKEESAKELVKEESTKEENEEEPGTKYKMGGKKKRRSHKKSIKRTSRRSSKKVKRRKN
jgi:hypothetical protein